MGGRFGDRLVVAVGARAVDGAATRAALTALAEAVGVRRRDVELVSGRTSRDKLVEIACADSEDERRLVRRVRSLLAAQGGGSGTGP